MKALAFLTPLGGAREPGPRTLDWFPLAGALIGFVLGGAWWVAGKVWPAAVAAAVVVVGDLCLTGMLHFDGLVDSADGLLAHAPRQARLDVMAGPEVGAFGLAVGASALLLRWVTLATLRSNVLLIAGLWCLSRTAMAVIARSQPYARAEGGLASAFSGERPGPVLLIGLIGGAASVGLLCAWRAGPGAAVAAASALSAGGVAWLSRRRLGGYTGDVLGAAGVVSETIGLAVAAARW